MSNLPLSFFFSYTAGFPFYPPNTGYSSFIRFFFYDTGFTSSFPPRCDSELLMLGVFWPRSIPEDSSIPLEAMDWLLELMD
jgi:hypothetical protein